MITNPEEGLTLLLILIFGTDILTLGANTYLPSSTQQMSQGVDTNYSSNTLAMNSSDSVPQLPPSTRTGQVMTVRQASWVGGAQVGSQHQKHREQEYVVTELPPLRRRHSRGLNLKHHILVS